MKKAVSVVVTLLLLLFLQTTCLAGDSNSLLVFSGAGLRLPMDEIGVAFTQKYGVEVHYSYAGSAQNLSQIELSGKGDVYVPGDVGYYDVAKEKGLVDEKKDVAYHVPAIGVPAGNPANIQSLKDMTRPGIKVILADEKAASIGKVGQKILAKAGIADAVNANVVAKAATVNELVVYLAMGQAEAVIAWEDNIANVDNVEIVPIAPEFNAIKTVPVCVVSHSQNKEWAKRFMDFVVSDEGKAIYAKYGFKPVN